MMETTIKQKIPTPLEKLYADKLYYKYKSNEIAGRLNDNFTYIQNNTGGLLLSSVTSLLSPAGKTSKVSGVATDYLSAINMFPQVWRIAKPFVVTWGISKIQSVILQKLFGRKKKK